MSRNDERLPGNLGQNNSGTDPLLGSLDYTTPTEFVDLPSKGRFYPPDHPLHMQETVEIKFMSSREEDILTSKSLLRKGLVIDRFLQSILVDKRINLDTLLVGDKNALIVAARITGYGSEYETSITCPNCEEKVKHTFDLDEIKVNEGDLEIEGVSLNSSNNVLITLPRTKWVVEVKFSTGVDEKWISQASEMRKKNKLPDLGLTDNLKRIIVSINNVTDPGLISSAVDKMPALDSKYLRLTYQKVSPGVDMKQVFTCEKCDSSQEVSVPFSATFFWPE